ncbi:MAG: sigma-70 family RNA polymerase sigma factor [bacterium]|nr:sigma-70 family RNA polymerase sigma factor [bacterium]
MARPIGKVTDLLDAWSGGDATALDELMPVVYDELHRLASRQFHRESSGHTLQPTAIVNEVYMRLKGQRQVRWRNRAEFFAVAAKLMRRVLVDHARRRSRLKRGGDVPKVPIHEVLAVAEEKAPDLIALDDALEGLADLAPRQSRIVELRVFGGLTLEEVAIALGIGRATVHRDWNAALLWLRRELISADQAT